MEQHQLVDVPVDRLKGVGLKRQHIFVLKVEADIYAVHAEL